MDYRAGTGELRLERDREERCGWHERWRIARSLEFVWETMPCNGAMRCDVCMAHGCSGDTVGADRCIRVHVYIVVAFYGAFRALRAHRAGIGFYTHTYAILLTRT